MTNPTQDQVLQRWDTLPMTIREALYSEANSDFLWKVGEAENVPDEKIYLISKVAGLVLMGFVHPEDAADEITQAAGIDPKSSKAIADQLNQRVFSPLRAEIDKAFAPPSKFEGGGIAPKMMQDIGTPMPIAPPPAGTAVASSPLSEKGWSRIAPGEPVIKLDTSNLPPPPPKPTAPSGGIVMPKPSAPASMPGASSLGEFARLKAMSETPPVPSAAPAPVAPPGIPKPPSPPPVAAPITEPAPIMLHEDTALKSVQQSTDFRLARPDESAISMAPQKTEAPVRPAVLELGKAAPTASPMPATGAAKVVHYTEYKTQVPPGGMMTEGGRSVSEITAAAPQPPGIPPAVPKPPAPPTPPAMPAAAPQAPKPPQAPQAPQEASKIITKDYL